MWETASLSSVKEQERSHGAVAADIMTYTGLQI
jgi:hypothetical protein